MSIFDENKTVTLTHEAISVIKRSLVTYREIVNMKEVTTIEKAIELAFINNIIKTLEK